MQHHDEVVVELEQQQLPAPRDAGERPALERVQRRVERLERVDPRRERRLDRLAGQHLGEPARHDLHLRQLGHAGNCRPAARRDPVGSRRGGCV
jgi:hypothetical protein